MSKNIQQLFESSRADTLSPGLESRVLARLEKEKKSLARRNLFIFGAADVLSGAGLVLTLIYVANLFVTSGFYNYISLFWSDTGAIGVFWQEMLLSLVESLPVLGLMAFLSVAAVLIFSLSKTIINFRLFYYEMS